MLLFDGFGGCNGVMPTDVMELTPDQVERWWLRPMAAMKGNKKDGGAEGPPSHRPPTAMKFAGIDQFKAAFWQWHSGKPEEWWQEKWNRWQENERNAAGT